jgi:predicted glycoside hydrolase/deacetylase ChbG (UPF0249 family)
MRTLHSLAPVSTDAQVRCRLIVHADDFGETEEITEGICQAIEAGAVTSTSIMANMPGTQAALPRVAALSDRASFGVHLNFCEGRPLTSGSSLVDDRGELHAKRALFLRALRGQLSPADLEAEVTAQIARIHEAGVRVSHVDGHKHLHQLPIVRNAVARVLPRFGIERVRVTRLKAIAAAKQPATLVREALAWQAERTFRRARLRSPARVLDLQAIMRPANAGGGASLARSAPEGPIEVFCHPGTQRADIAKPGSCARFEELTFLLSPRFQDVLSASRARMVSYWDV